jgi:hypothetical protein
MKPLLTPQPLSVFFNQNQAASQEIPLDLLVTAVDQSPLLQLAPDPASADLRVEAEGDAVYRLYVAGETLALAVFRIPVKKVQALPRKLERILEHIAAYRNLLNLQPATPALSSVIKLEFLQLLEPATRQRAATVTPLPINAAGEVEIHSGQTLAVALTNLAPTPIYVYLIALNNQQHSCSLLYPYQKDLPARLRPHETLLIGSGPKFLLQMQLPEGDYSSTDIFKLFVSGKTIEPSVLQLPSLGQKIDPITDPYGAGSRLDRDLRKIMLGLVGSTPLPDFVEDPWWCQQQSIRIVGEK